MVQRARPLSRRTRWFTAAGALLLAALSVAGPIRDAARLGDRLSPVADPFSEADALRSALGILDRGWTANAGLPELTYGNLHPQIGHAKLYRGRTYVDTHYPPGPAWLTAVMKIACQGRPLSCARTLPIAVSALGAFVLAFALLVSLGPARGIVAAAALFSVPLYTNMMLGLHYQGYALALLSMQLGALLLVFTSGRAVAARDLVLAAGLGFLQGWLSFDYFFLVALAPVPLALLFFDLRAPGAQRRLLVLATASTAGFALAHALHFAQVVAYHGGLTAAVQDLAGAAMHRADPALSEKPPPEWVQDPWMLSNLYLFVLSKGDTMFGFRLGWALLATLAASILLPGARFRVPWARLRLIAEPSARPAWAIVAAVIVACAWISLMRSHAFYHTHFLPRHLFLAWLVLVLALLSFFRVEAEPGPRARHAATIRPEGPA